MATRPIVVGYDSQPAEAALAWALDEADRSRLPVRLVYAFEWFGLGTPVAAGVAWPDPRPAAKPRPWFWTRPRKPANPIRISTSPASSWTAQPPACSPSSPGTPR